TGATMEEACTAWREQFGGPAMLVASARNALAAVVEAERDGVATPVVDAAFAALARADFSLGDRTATPRRPAWRAALRVPWEQMWASMINARGSAAADPPSRCESDAMIVVSGEDAGQGRIAEISGWGAKAARQLLGAESNRDAGPREALRHP
ncbi:MAG TPA: hypothetical protein PJ982_06210, partial [Lacipirellulaceae bacterium]|nr:hypothetical protein [Lacipirellulaceae bacterium]